MTPIHETDCAAMRFELELIIQELADIEKASTRLRPRISVLLNSTEAAVALAPEANTDPCDAAAPSDDVSGGDAAPNSANGYSAPADLPSQSDVAYDLAGPQAFGHIVKVAATALEYGLAEEASHSSVNCCDLREPIEIVIASSVENVDFVPADVELPPTAEPIRLIALPVINGNQAVVVIIPSPKKPMNRSWVAPSAPRRLSCCWHFCSCARTAM